ncbi:hypothetical protein ACFWPH_25870 [Nocardia sp. NPDC058499]|uniref:hypothetical protein n=1 Tax=Nocardia sp. NPDC058499 TaxID=3346530 RepID=UPI0036480437
MVVVTGLAACGPQESAPARLESVVARVVETSPDRDSGEYRPPSPETAAAVAAAVTELLESGTVDRVPDTYRLEDITTGDDDTLEGLVEQGRPTAGNGLYVARPPSATRSPVVVQIPHPVADKHTEDMGTQLFAETDAQLFMLAGAHRNAGDDSADVAHRDDSTFAAVNDAVIGADTVVVQLHGFSADKHDDDYGEVVLSSSVDEPSPLLRQMADDLEDNGFDTCVYNGKRCRQLAATTNVQAVQARARGAEFIHIEVDHDIRDSRSDSRELVRVIGETLRAAGVG